MIVDLLLWAILLTAVLQPTRDRAVPALMFAVPAVLHGLLLGDTDGLYYYLSAALVDIGVLAVLSSLSSRSELVVRLAHISTASIVLNATGWVVWMLYLPPDGYNLSFIVLYAYALFTLTRRSRRHGYGGRTMDHRRGVLRRDPHPCRRATDGGSRTLWG
jgi:hypothetical protein